MQSRTVAVRLQRLEASFDRLEPGVGRRGASPGNTHEMVGVTLVTTHPFSARARQASIWGSVRLQMVWDNLSCLGTEALARLD